MRRGIAECPIQLCVQCWSASAVQGAPGIVGAVYHPISDTGAHVIMTPCTRCAQVHDIYQTNPYVLIRI